MAIILMCVFSISSKTTLVSTADDGSSLMRSAIENNLAIRNYDVIVTLWCARNASNPNDIAALPAQEERLVFRQVFDRENMKGLRVRFLKPDWDGRVNVPEWGYESFFDGVHNTRTFNTRAKIGNSNRKSNFDEFCLRSRIMHLEMISFWGHLNSEDGPTFEEKIETYLTFISRAKSRHLPDGTTSVTIIDDSDNERRFMLSASTLMPVKVSIDQVVKSKRKNYCSTDVEYEESKGVQRVVRLVGSRSSFAHSQLKPIESVPFDENMIMDIEWLQFNEEKLEFPSAETLGMDVVEWAKFLNLKNEDAKKVAR